MQDEGQVQFKRGRLKRLVVVLFLLAGSFGLVSIGLKLYIHRTCEGRVYREVTEVPSEDEPRIAIVFGAGVWPNGQPSPVLYDRVATAADLYHAGKARKLLLTGDNRFHHYNEPEVMRQTALKLGVPDQALVLDFAGRRTYDSAFRAAHIFCVKRAILVTQAFHLERSLYLCRSLGIDAIGVQADRQPYPARSQKWWSFREFLATTGAWCDIHVLQPRPVLGDKLPID